MDTRHKLTNFCVVLHGVPAFVSKERVSNFACGLGISRIISLEWFRNDYFATSNRQLTFRWTVRCDNEEGIRVFMS